MNDKINNLKTLLEHQLIDKEDEKAIKAVLQQFQVGISPQVLDLIKTTDSVAIKKQFIPDPKELEMEAHTLKDPIGDQQHSPIKGIVHRYPDRCLLKVSHVCPVYCRFCFRRHLLQQKKDKLHAHELEQAFEYIEAHSEIWEVILTGGDPLILKPLQLQAIMHRLESISHVEIIRIHTRVPMMDPERVTLKMIRALKCSKPVYIAVHANHPDEFNPASIEVIAKLADAGFPLLSQTVLLKGINDEAEVLKKLMRNFVKNRIKPYYLHHCDLAAGTEHFRTTIEKGQDLMRALRGHISGLCQPTYVLDLPGGHGKVALAPEASLELISEKTYRLRDHKNQQHLYQDATED